MLGYVFAGKSYLIPQITCTLDFINNTLEASFIADNFERENYELHIIGFKRKLISFLAEKRRSSYYIKDDFQEIKNLINIGLYKNKWYITSSNPLIDINAIANKVLAYLFNNLNLFLPPKSSREGQISKVGNMEFKHRQDIDIMDHSFGFIFVKTAFNVMAYLKGQKFVLSDIFDNIRKDIVECNDMTPYIVPCEVHSKIFNKHICELPQNAHCAYILSEGNLIYAYVTFYNEWHAHMILTENYTGENFGVGFVCDWKEKKEYTIK